MLYDAPKKEITSVIVAPDGTIYAAGVGEKGRNNLPPLPVTGQVTATITIITPGSVQAFNGNTLIPEGSELYEIPHGDGPPRKIWSGHDDILYSLAWTPDGVLAATGNRGRIYRIHDDGTWADVAHLEASQVTGFADSAERALRQHGERRQGVSAEPRRIRRRDVPQRGFRRGRVRAMGASGGGAGCNAADFDSDVCAGREH